MIADDNSDEWYYYYYMYYVPDTKMNVTDNTTFTTENVTDTVTTESIPSTVTTTAIQSTVAPQTDGLEDTELYIIFGAVAGSVALIIICICVTFALRNKLQSRRNIRQYNNRRARMTQSQEILNSELGIGSSSQANGVNNNTYGQHSQAVLPISYTAREPEAAYINSQIKTTQQPTFAGSTATANPNVFIIKNDEIKSSPAQKDNTQNNEKSLAVDADYDRPKTPSFSAINYGKPLKPPVSPRVKKSGNGLDTKPAMEKYDTPRALVLPTNEEENLQLIEEYDTPNKQLYKIPKTMEKPTKGKKPESPYSLPRSCMLQKCTNEGRTETGKISPQNERKADLLDLPSYENCDSLKSSGTPPKSPKSPKGKTSSNTKTKDSKATMVDENVQLIEEYDTPKKQLYKIPKPMEKPTKGTQPEGPYSLTRSCMLPVAGTPSKSPKSPKGKALPNTKTNIVQDSQTKMDEDNSIDALPSYENCEDLKLVNDVEKHAANADSHKSSGTPPKSHKSPKGKPSSNIKTKVVQDSKTAINSLPGYENCEHLKLVKDKKHSHKLDKQGTQSKLDEGQVSPSYENSETLKSLKASSPLMPSNQRRQRDKARAQTHIGIATTEPQKASDANPLSATVDKQSGSDVLSKFSNIKKTPPKVAVKLKHSKTLGNRFDLESHQTGQIYSNIREMSKSQTNVYDHANGIRQINYDKNKEHSYVNAKSDNYAAGNKTQLGIKTSTESEYEDPDAVDAHHINEPRVLAEKPNSIDASLEEDDDYTPMDIGTGILMEDDVYTPMASLDDDEDLRMLKSHTMKYHSTDRTLSANDSTKSPVPCKAPPPCKQMGLHGYINISSDPEPKYQNF